MTERGRRSAAPARRTLDSPWVAGGLAAIVLVLAAVLIVPGLIGGPAPGASATPAGTGSPAATESASPATPTFARPTPSPAATFLSYVVRQGDTLSSIAKQFATTPRSIAWWNRGTYPSLDPETEAYNPDRLEVGWTLVLIPGVVVDDTNPPTPSPGPSSGPSSGPSAKPTPSATAAAVVTPAPGKPATVISHGDRALPEIALTFDMGGRLDPAVDTVQWLIDHGVHATLFPTGKSGTQTALGLAAMELAAEHPDLFDFGNHSWSHPDFRDLTAAEMAEQVTSTETALQPIVGSTKPWFRPPFGGYNAAVKAGVGAAGWKYLVMWDVDTIDWRPVDNGSGPPGPTTSQIVAKIRDNAKGGSIVLMHLGGYNTLAALPGILDALEDKGLFPVTLTEMLAS